MLRWRGTGKQLATLHERGHSMHNAAIHVCCTHTLTPQPLLDYLAHCNIALTITERQGTMLLRLSV